MDKAHLTAGHCFLDRAGRVDQNLAKDSVLQFNVPSSNANCTINHPPVARQFPVKRGMVIAGLLDRICNAASTNAGAKCVADAECLGADPNRRCVVNGFCNAASANPGAACDPNRDAGNPHADCLGADPNRRCIVNAFCNAASTNANAPCNKDADCLGANPNRRCDGSTIGNDWAVFKCGKNNEGKTTYEKQGTAMPLAPAVPVVGTTLYVTGYGVDGTDADNAGGGTPASCTCNPGRNTGTRNAVLQTHSGPLLLGGPKADRLNHQVDTCGGNSGSPINNPGASFTPVIGIHTNAGCGADGGGGVVGANAGTAITNPDLVAAMEKLGRKKLPPVCGNNLREGTEACDGTDAACCLLGPCQPDCTCPSASPVNYGCACADNTDFSGSAVDCNLALDGPGGCVSLCATHGGIRKPEPPDGPPDQSPELHGFACPQSCVPGDHWIDCCTAGIDKLESNALVGIDTNMDCMLDPDPAVEPRLFFSGPVTILRSRPTDVSMNDFPPTPPKTPPFDDMLDGHFDVMDTEIIHMRMTGGSGDCLVRLTAGAEKGQRFPLNPSLGAIVERPAAVPWTCAFPLTRCADSFFEVFFEIELGDGTFLYNQDPLLVHAEIDQVPPDLGTKYVHGLVGDVCIPLYTSPTGGVRVANFIQGDHLIVKPPATGCCLVDCSCTNIDPAMCTQAGGVPANNNRKCSGGDRDGQRCDDLNPCPRGTCVPGSGSCRGDDGKDCVDDACLVACCDHLKGTCTDVQMSKCDCEQCTFTCGTTCAALVAAGGCPAEIWACCDHDTFGICTNTTHNACNCAKCEWTKGKLCDEVECTHKTIPTVSEWGLVVMTLLLLTGAKIYFGRRPLETRD